jgi:adenylate kinase
MRLVIMGPPGAGKGTQARLISEHLGVPAISTGDIFRANVAAGTELGLEAQGYMAAGEYVPDDVTSRMVELRLAEADAVTGFLLDGYPRTVAQVHVLDSILTASGKQLDGVVVLAVNHEEVMGRLSRRREGRADDTPEVIRHRLHVYEEQTAPLVAAFKERGLIVQVDGAGSPPAVTCRLLAAVAHLSSARR